MKIEIKKSVLLKKLLVLITNEKGKGLKTLTPKQMLQRISIELHN